MYGSSFLGQIIYSSGKTLIIIQIHLKVLYEWYSDVLKSSFDS